MTLDSTEKVYQADLMHITPMADAMIYGYGGDWILAGLDYEITASGIEIQPGRAIIQGHLYTLNSTKIVPLTTGQSGFVGWSIDLTRDNSATGSDVTNNQYTFGFFTGTPSGNTLDGDTSATIALYQITAAGSTWNAAQKIYLYKRSVSYSTPPAGSQCNDKGFYVLAERVGYQIHFHISISGGLPTFNGSPITILPENLNDDLIPNDMTWAVGELSGAAIASRIVLYGRNSSLGIRGRLSLYRGFGMGGTFDTSHTYTYGNLWADLYAVL